MIGKEIRSGSETTPKLNEEQLNILKEIVSANNDATLEEIRNELATSTGILICHSTVDRMLHRMEIRVKKTLHASEKETESLIPFTQEELIWLRWVL